MTHLVGYSSNLHGIKRKFLLGSGHKSLDIAIDSKYEGMMGKISYELSNNIDLLHCFHNLQKK